MSSHLCLSVRFLDPAFHGRARGTELEWPPSPLRLFQAIVAASAARWREPETFDEYAGEALRWLECRQHPVVVAPRQQPGSSYRLYVPNNAMDRVASAWRRGKDGSIAEHRTEKDVRPTHLLNGDAVHYLWELSNAARTEFDAHKDILFAAARNVVALGWGIDMAIGNGQLLTNEDADNLPGERWRPVTRESPTQLRVPRQGTLAALMARHKAFLNRLPPSGGFVPVPPLTATAFHTIGYRRATDPSIHPFVAFKLLDPENDRFAWFPATCANCVAAMTRHATATAAKHQPKEWVDSYVHGHRSTGEDTKPRFSYLPLPTIEHRGAGGRVVGGIRRVVLAELIEASASYLSWARQMLPGEFLIDKKTDKKAMLAPLNESDWVLRQYMASSDTWATVTPVVLPGSDDGKFAKAKKLFEKALRHAGYCPEMIAHLEFRNVSFWPGGDLALKYQRPEYLKKDHWSVYHVFLRWKEAIEGPMALGAGRHCGLGVFAAMND